MGPLQAQCCSPLSFCLTLSAFRSLLLYSARSKQMPAARLRCAARASGTSPRSLERSCFCVCAGGGDREGGRTEVGDKGRAQAGIQRSGNPLPHLSTVIEGSPPPPRCGFREPPPSRPHLQVQGPQPPFLPTMSPSFPPPPPHLQVQGPQACLDVAVHVAAALVHPVWGERRGGCPPQPCAITGEAENIVIPPPLTWP